MHTCAVNTFQSFFVPCFTLVRKAMDGLGETLLVGPKNLSALRKSGMSVFQGYNVQLLIEMPKQDCLLELVVHISEVCAAMLELYTSLLCLVCIIMACVCTHTHTHT